MLWIALFMPALSCNSGQKAAEIEKLRHERKELIARIESLQDEQRFLLFEKEIHATDKRYIVLDVKSGTGSIRIGGKILRELKLAKDACARPDGAPPGEAESYALPRGVIKLIAKKKEPVWYKPDWLYVKEGGAPPPVNAPERLIKGPMGENALFFGGGFVIHGRPAEGSSTAPMQHACIMLEDDDLRVAYNVLEIGSPAYIR